MPPLATVAILLGSNQEPRHHLRHAVARLGRLGWVVACSRVYESADVAARGCEAAPPSYLNAALLLETALAPAELRAGLKVIEADLGRPAGAAAVPIDLDLALYEDRVVDDPAAGLRLPHPDILRHRHAAVPLAELLPDRPHPSDGRTFARIAAELAAQDDGRGAVDEAAAHGAPARSSHPVPVTDLDLMPRPPRPKDPRERVLATFFQGEALRQIPLPPAAFRIVIAQLVSRFDFGRDYPEPEVNRLLLPVHPDVATLRRGLVDLGHLRRADGIYRRTG